MSLPANERNRSGILNLLFEALHVRCSDSDPDTY